MPEFPGRLRPPRLAGAPSSPAPGEIYFDTTTNVLSSYNGTVGISLYRAYPLAYMEPAADVSVTGNSPATANTIVTAPSVSFDGQPVWLEFSAGVVQPASAAGANIIISFYEGATEITASRCIVYNPVAAAMIVPVTLRKRMTPSAASHTYAVKAYQAGGNGTIGGNTAGWSTYLSITKA